MVKPDNMIYIQETYWCSKCKRFHKPKFKSKLSVIHKEHFCYFSRYKRDFSQAELFNMNIKNSWKRNVKKEKEKKKERANKPLFIN